jgi:hypothetical protein
VNRSASQPFDAERVRAWAENHNEQRMAVAGFVGLVTGGNWRANCRECTPRSPTQNVAPHSHPYLIEEAV